MPKISDSYRTSRQKVILDAAVRCFARSGIAGTTMADIQRESGISIGGIYRYFPGKQDILLEITRQDQEYLNATLIDAITIAESPRECLPALMKALTQYRDEHPVDVNRLAVSSWLEASSNNELQELLATSFRTVTDVFSQRLTDWSFPEDDHPTLINTIRVFVFGHIALNVLDGKSAGPVSLDVLSMLPSFLPDRAI
ncbi:MAG: TetR/AcrR family transcriptional regulator [Flaviflexus sp.]|nr:MULTISPECIES: TetR/AcrR family transcriptional regulator [Micrococcales]MDN5754992.1 TetR/AcrR family transcriptional regulator [Micrococcaceae bacterium]MDN5816554.1 TetR/AcrR family transcriptional regulator [Yaniella sp.]